MDDLDQLVGHMLTFARVVEANSFGAGARRLGLTTSVASKHVAKLEKSLGARLLNRSTRKLSLTEAGSTFYAYCTRLVDEIEAAQEAIADLQIEPSGSLRISGPPSMVAMHVAPLLGEFRRRFPLVELELDLTNRVVDLAEEGFDLALRVTREPASSLLSRRLTPIRMGTFAAPEYLRRHGTPQQPQDLADHECLLFSIDGETEDWLLKRDGQTQHVRVRGNFRSNVMEPLHAMARHAIGIVRLPNYMVGEDVARGHLVPLLRDWASFDGTHIFAVWPAARRNSRKLHLFVDLLVEHFGEEPYWDRQMRAAAPA